MFLILYLLHAYCLLSFKINNEKNYIQHAAKNLTLKNGLWLRTRKKNLECGKDINTKIWFFMW